jgi:hypothetical protein
MDKCVFYINAYTVGFFRLFKAAFDLNEKYNLGRAQDRSKEVLPVLTAQRWGKGLVREKA